jgi:hypothetical protein
MATSADKSPKGLRVPDMHRYWNLCSNVRFLRAGLPLLQVYKLRFTRANMRIIWARMFVLQLRRQTASRPVPGTYAWTTRPGLKQRTRCGSATSIRGGNQMDCPNHQVLNGTLTVTTRGQTRDLPRWRAPCRVKRAFQSVEASVSFSA